MVNNKFHINLSKDNNLGYDMIIGWDLMKKLGMIVNFKNKNLIWYDVIVPMWGDVTNHPKTPLNRAKIEQVIRWMDDTRVTSKATKIIVKMIYSKYKKVNLEEISQSAHQLDEKEQVMLIHLLKEF